ncbi:MAG: type IV pili twitching motility protein PilT, partial [Candidatus Omnitrophota bacterium]
QALERIIHMFPVEHKDEICIRLSSCLQGVIAQLLIPSADGINQILASEVLVSNSAVRHIVRENKLFQLSSTMQTGQQFNMHTFEKSLDELFTKGLISGNTLTVYLQDIASKRADVT